MAIKFESAPAPQGKAPEKRAAAPRPPVVEESKKLGEAPPEKAKAAKGPVKKIQQRNNLKKKT